MINFLITVEARWGFVVKLTVSRVVGSIPHGAPIELFLIPATFYLRLYGIRHMVKDHSDNERKPAAPTWVTLCN